MSLIINADGEYIEGAGFAGGTGLTEATFGIWVKRDSGTSGTQSYACVGPDFNDNADCMTLAHNGTQADCWLWPGNAETRVNGIGDANSTAWQLLLLTYKQGVEDRVYTAITGGSVSSGTRGSSAATLVELIDSIRIGKSGFGLGDWYARARLAHCFFYDIALSGAQVSELFNGGTAGAGKNPQAVANANLKFYAPLTSDATVTVGGISLSPTGTITYDGADNPNVEAYGSTHNVTVANSTSANTSTAVVITSSATTGTLTTAPLKNNAGTLLANETGATAYIHHMTTGALIVAKTGQTTNASGVMTVTDAAIAAGTQYRIVVKLSSNAEGLDKLTAT